MVALLLAGIMITGIMFGGFLFAVWALREHLQARRYRMLMIAVARHKRAAVHTSNVGPQWEVKYKEKGKIKSEMIAAKSESEALREFVKKNSRAYNSIVEVVKC